MLSRVLHIMCLIKCSSDIFELFWTLVSSKFWDYPWLNLYNMFWSLGVCFTHFDPNVPIHALPYISKAHLMHTTCTLDAHTCTVVIFLHFNDIYMFYHLNHVHLTLLYFVLSVMLLFWTNLTLIKFLLLFVCFYTSFLCCVFTCADVSHQALCL